MRAFVWGLVILLLVLHQDNWNWENAELVFGFLPVGLAYHACLSVACAVVWYLATKLAWPDELIESVVEESEDTQ